nr:MAG TPA: hypothetical protein [Caudoviricetes sp.]
MKNTAPYSTKTPLRRAYLGGVFASYHERKECPK